MDKLIAQMGRQNHLQHLTQILPFITTIFGVQCFFIYKFVTDIQVGDYALIMGMGLIGFIYALFYYDNNHHVLVYSKYLHVFPVFGRDKKLMIGDIENILAPDEECNFSTIIIELKNKERHVFYFVDYPLHMKKLIEEQMNIDDTSLDQAA